MRLTLGGELDIKILFGQVEIRRERLDDVVIIVDGQRKRRRFVFPGNAIEIQEPGELDLDGMCESLWGIGVRLRLHTRSLISFRVPVKSSSSSEAFVISQL